MKVYVTEIEMNGDVFGLDFTDINSAIKYLADDWEHMTDSEKEKSQYARISLYEVNEDEELFLIDTVFEIK